jgi:hypothetical protein
MVCASAVLWAQEPSSEQKQIAALTEKIKALEAKLAQPKLSNVEQLEKIQAQYTAAFKAVVEQIGPGCKAVGLKVTSITIGADGKASATCGKR